MSGDCSVTSNEVRESNKMFSHAPTGGLKMIIKRPETKVIEMEKGPVINLPDDVADGFGTYESINIKRALFVAWGDGDEKQDLLLKSRFQKLMQFAKAGYDCGLKTNKVVTMVMQIEKCPSTGRYHIQGFFRFERQVRTASINKMLGFNLFILKAQCYKDGPIIAYCTKTEKDCLENPQWAGKGGRVSDHEPFTEPFIFGEQDLGQGKVNMQFVKEELIKGTSCDQLIWDNPLLADRKKAVRNLCIAYQSIKVARRDKNVRKLCYLLIGDAGYGKDITLKNQVNLIKEKNPNFDCYVHKGNDWFCTYNGEEIMYIPEFQFGKWPVDEILLLTDNWNMYQGGTKGGDPLKIWPYFMFFSTNVPIIEWFNIRGRTDGFGDPGKKWITEKQYNALKRRFWVLEFKKDVNGKTFIKDHGDPDPPKKIELPYDPATGKAFSIDIPKITVDVNKQQGAIWKKKEEPQPASTEDVMNAINKFIPVDDLSEAEKEKLAIWARENMA